MDYREFAPPDSLSHLVKAGWALAVPRGREWTSHVATPDGCMELIRRTGGRSDWNGEQPKCFVAGMISRPAELRLSGGSSYVGLRIWPWTWHALTGRSPAGLIDRWTDLATEGPGLELPTESEKLFSLVDALRLDVRSETIARAIAGACSCSELAGRTQLSPRAVQRWFARNVGIAPRAFLRLLRFSDAFAELPRAGSTLAAHAFDHGFADQAHMAREFRSLAGAQARRIRNRGRGPFLADTNGRG